MTKFISNVNKYLSEMKIKQSYLSMVTGIDKNKMSRLLTVHKKKAVQIWRRLHVDLGKVLDFF